MDGRLSPGELQAFELVKRGCSPKEVAFHMNLDRTTAHYYLKALKDFYGARHLYHLTAIAQHAEPGPPAGQSRKKGRPEWTPDKGRPLPAALVIPTAPINEDEDILG